MSFSRDGIYQCQCNQVEFYLAGKDTVVTGWGWVSILLSFWGLQSIWSKTLFRDVEGIHSLLFPVVGGISSSEGKSPHESVPEDRQGRGFWRGWGDEIYGVFGTDDIKHPSVSFCPPVVGESCYMSTKADFRWRWHQYWFAALEHPIRSIFWLGERLGSCGRADGAVSLYFYTLYCLLRGWSIYAQRVESCLWVSHWMQRLVCLLVEKIVFINGKVLHSALYLPGESWRVA